LLLASN